MNILYLCDEYPPGRHGGIGTAVQTLAREMVREGHSVIVAGFYDWGYGGENEYEDQGVRVYRLRRRLDWGVFRQHQALPSRALHKLFRVAGTFHRAVVKSIASYESFVNKLILTHAVDVVVMPDYQDYMRYCKAYVPVPVFQAPVIVQLHGSIAYFTKEGGGEIPPHILRMEQEMLDRAKLVISVSEYAARKTKEYLRFQREIPVVYNGMQIVAVEPSEKDYNQVIFTGSLAEKKGIFQLMKAWNLVTLKVPKARLVIYGKGNVKKLESLLTSESRKTVTFGGHIGRSELLRKLAGAGMAVFPSFAESFGLAPLEAMMCGTATIFTRTTSGPELIRDGIDGLLVDPAKAEDIAEKMVTLLQDTALNHKLAQNGRETVSKRFDIKKIAGDHIQLYATVLK